MNRSTYCIHIHYPPYLHIILYINLIIIHPLNNLFLSLSVMDISLRSISTIQDYHNRCCAIHSLKLVFVVNHYISGAI